MFWRLTPRQIALVFKSEARRRDRETELAYFTAYHAGVYSQTYKRGRFPKYRPPGGQRQKAATPPNWQELKRRVMAINASMGGEIRKRDS